MSDGCYTHFLWKKLGCIRILPEMLLNRKDLGMDQNVILLLQAKLFRAAVTVSHMVLPVREFEGTQNLHVPKMCFWTSPFFASCLGAFQGICESLNATGLCFRTQLIHILYRKTSNVFFFNRY